MLHLLHPQFCTEVDPESPVPAACVPNEVFDLKALVSKQKDQIAILDAKVQKMSELSLLNEENGRHAKVSVDLEPTDVTQFMGETGNSRMSDPFWLGGMLWSIIWKYTTNQNWEKYLEFALCLNHDSPIESCAANYKLILLDQNDYEERIYERGDPKITRGIPSEFIRIPFDDLPHRNKVILRVELDVESRCKRD